MKLGTVASLGLLLCSAGVCFAQSSVEPTPTASQPEPHPGKTESGSGENGHAAEAEEETECEEIHRHRLYARMEYLLWWIREVGFVPLVSSGSPLDARPGAL